MSTSEEFEDEIAEVLGERQRENEKVREQQAERLTKVATERATCQFVMQWFRDFSQSEIGMLGFTHADCVEVFSWGPSHMARPTLLLHRGGRLGRSPHILLSEAELREMLADDLKRLRQEIDDGTVVETFKKSVLHAIRCSR